MSKQERNAYILGTDREELHRLGLQHQVWSSEARQAWATAGFSAGQTLLDLGCGPGFCSQELAYIAGASGQVIGVDQSEGFIRFARSVNELHGLNIDYQSISFDDMTLPPGSLDGAYCRWALAWVPDPIAVLVKVVAALRPGACFAVHEYYDWSTLRTEPRLPAINGAIAAALGSFEEADGQIDIGRRLPASFQQLGLDVIEVRPMSKLALPDSLTWHWPDSFFKSYLPRLVAAGRLRPNELDAALAEWEQLSSLPGASCQCPQMVEVIARKPA